MKENDNIIELEKVKQEKEKKRINELTENFVANDLNKFLETLPDTYSEFEKDVSLVSYVFTTGYLYGKDDAKKEIGESK